MGPETSLGPQPDGMSAAQGLGHRSMQVSPPHQEQGARPQVPLNPALPARLLHTATFPQGLQPAVLLSAVRENASGCPAQPQETLGSSSQ